MRYARAVSHSSLISALATRRDARHVHLRERKLERPLANSTLSRGDGAVTARKPR
jgi:hypothetical protein